MSNPVVAPSNVHEKIQYLVNNNHFEEAYRTCVSSIETHPKDRQLWWVLAAVALHTGKFDKALQANLTVATLANASFEVYFQRVVILERMLRITDAITLAEEQIDLAAKQPAQLQQLITFFQRHHDFANIEQCYRSALLNAPEHPFLLLGLANTLAFLGKLSEAETVASSALRDTEFDADVYFMLAHLKSVTRENNHINEMLARLKKGVNDPLRQAKLFYSVAKEYEDCAKYAESFHFRQQGAQIYRKTFNYQVQEEIRFLRAIRENYTADSVSKLQVTDSIDGNSNARPIFIVGLPRTGTTLLERMVGNHPEVCSLGELPHFSRAMDNAMAALNLPDSMTRDQMVTHSVKLNFAALGQEYLAMCLPQVNSASVFIDKFPQNATYAGLLSCALPKAKILLLERHPLDVCYAVYKQLFTADFLYSYDLEELAEYFIEHHKLMAHWQAVLQDSLMVVRYEDLVENQRHTLINVLDFCGLEWSEQCVSFEQNKQASTTASLAQVRQKLYTSSMGKWQHYRKQLTPLIERLTAAGCLDQWEV